MFGVGVVKNVDPDKYVDSNYGIRFVSCSAFSLSDGSMGACHYFWSWYELICVY